ncbi:ribonuclease H-like domain-containing protein [Lentinula detonsa]|uniref:Ribonuclease H-like domain-containing protein n=1 Tax=Lentinula detonsa TaxID=2804962 RepID=A0AA38Q6H0_9AGAR|nr:ribonuclease H-like domain-containing protein [Lentinula detonsa]
MSFKESSISSRFNEMNSRIQTSALKATRNSMLLPSDINFHRTMDTEFSRDLDAFSSRILSIANQVIALMGTADQSTKTKGKLENEDDVVDNFHSVVVDTVDRMMERTDMNLDEFLGRNKAPAIAIDVNTKPIVKNKQTTGKTKGALDQAIQHASHLPKPQLKFKKRVNNDDVPWYPSLSHKYNARIPLGSNFHDPDFEVETDDPIKLHPYRYEITHISYPSRMFQSSEPIPPTPFQSTTFESVSNVNELQSMLDNLRGATEIAVDLEHHNYRSYWGFLCLMQISTRQKDWIVDLLELREELGMLNEVFTNPNIAKIFHGAESDIVWLQQDFNIYIVNLFDTFHASKILGFPRHGLANLLEMYCDFTPDKRYQLADWRIRPLPQEMLDYARSDTHFLLYIYDNLRNALLDRAVSPSELSMAAEDTSRSSQAYPPTQALIRQVLAKSEATALRVYEKERYDMEGGSGGNGWDTLARKWNKTNLYASSPSIGIAGIQKDIYKRIHLWRDTVAREEDESIRFVLPNHYLFQLAEQPPGDMASMLKIFHFVPPILRKRAKELLDVVREVIGKPIASEERLTHDVTIPGASLMLVEQQHSSNVTNSLWTLGSSSANLSASSALFGSVKLKSITPSVNENNENNVASIVSPRSTLFGNALPQASGTLPVSRFAEVVARIHSTLVIAPSTLRLSHVSLTEKTTLTHESTSVSAGTQDDEDDETLPAAVQVEMPFVPSAQRAMNAGNVQPGEDTIVMVGQARQKKRKRVKPVPNPGEGKSKESDGNTISFDFASAPNILDAAPAAEQTAVPRKKAKQTKGRGAFYGDFPAPPKAYSEVKSGNKSHTFK